ncbi:APC10-domain-containing protein [Tilletiaria anomala UBC 951]|uniref:APC10-domain-containing protein n=1 Tax=Tilletiaria anomala (strain ATCC 24038 / CBS 436.72 / UBC 951) TaxID=1037660 RepID=A0A066WP03_TILAU|nr:APC10-domain-containing protein [Tilletiaria anomala UBC 951]KDN52734.1 APC10-domain-containing protein [Tilletiaria anomala UBC 951]
MPPPSSMVPSLYNTNDLTNKQDLGSLPGVKWTLSSHKPGAGVAALRDPDLSKLWQSDGTQPHVVDIQFPRRTAVTHVSIYLDTTLDDSYTPTNIGIKAGTYFGDLAEIRRRELEAPKGWVHFVLNPESTGANEETSADLKLAPPIWVYHLQICIYSNHLNGKDTHLRSIRVFGPPSEERKAAALKQQVQAKLLDQAKLAGSAGSGPHDKVHSDIRTRYAYESLRKAIDARAVDEDEKDTHFAGDDDFDVPERAHTFDLAGRSAGAGAPHLPSTTRSLALHHSLR